MHDSIRLEKMGIPTVTIVHDNFEAAARAQAKLMGLPDMKLAVMPRPTAVTSEETKEQTVAMLFETVRDALLVAVPTV